LGQIHRGDFTQATALNAMPGLCGRGKEFFALESLQIFKQRHQKNKISQIVIKVLCLKSALAGQNSGMAPV
jgi:hypothetical protein